MELLFDRHFDSVNMKLCYLLELITTTTIAAHPWLLNNSGPIPLDILIYKLVKSYLHASPFKRAALKVLFISFLHTCHCISLFLYLILKKFRRFMRLYAISTISDNCYCCCYLRLTIFRLFQKLWQRMNWYILEPNLDFWNQMEMDASLFRILKWLFVASNSCVEFWL